MPNWTPLSERIHLYQRANAHGWRWNRTTRVWWNRDLQLTAPHIGCVIDFLNGRIGQASLNTTMVQMVREHNQRAQERFRRPNLYDRAMQRAYEIQNPPFVPDEWRA